MFSNRIILNGGGCNYYSAQPLFRKLKVSLSSCLRKFQQLDGLLFMLQPSCQMSSYNRQTKRIQKEKQLTKKSLQCDACCVMVEDIKRVNNSSWINNSNVYVDDQATNFNQQYSQSEYNLIKKYKKLFSATNTYSEAIFVLGAMGVGKTKTINDEFRSHATYSQYAYVDTDEIMEQLDGFNENKVDMFYPVARRVSIKLTDWLLEKNISFVAEGTCVKYIELEDYMIRLKENGYNIKVRKVNSVPLETVVTRARNRTRRHVADEVIKDIYLYSQIGIKELFERNSNKQLFEEIVFL